MITEQVAKVMRGNLKKIAKKGVKLEDARLKIGLEPTGEPYITAMSGRTEIERLGWGKVLGLMFALAPQVEESIHNKLTGLSESEGIPVELINVRISAADKKANPRAHLFNGDKLVRAAEIEELV